MRVILAQGSCQVLQILDVSSKTGTMLLFFFNKKSVCVILAQRAMQNFLCAKKNNVQLTPCRTENRHSFAGSPILCGRLFRDIRTFGRAVEGSNVSPLTHTMGGLSGCRRDYDDDGGGDGDDDTWRSSLSSALQNLKLLLQKRQSQLVNREFFMPLSRCVLVSAPLIPLSAMVKLTPHQWSHGCLFRGFDVSTQELSARRQWVALCGTRRMRRTPMRAPLEQTALPRERGRPLWRGSALKHLASHAGGNGACRDHGGAPSWDNCWFLKTLASILVAVKLCLVHHSESLNHFR